MKNVNILNNRFLYAVINKNKKHFLNMTLIQSARVPVFLSECVLVCISLCPRLPALSLPICLLC